MHHKTKELQFGEGAELKVIFRDGETRIYDMRQLYGKYPTLKALEDRQFFETGKLYPYGIRWNDEIDIDAETIYADGAAL